MIYEKQDADRPVFCLHTRKIDSAIYDVYIRTYMQQHASTAIAKSIVLPSWMILLVILLTNR